MHVHLQNAAGHDYNLCYGFGVLNAADMITKALEWTLVGEQLTHEVPGALTSRETREIPSNGNLILRVRNAVIQIELPGPQSFSSTEPTILLVSTKHLEVSRSRCLVLTKSIVDSGDENGPQSAIHGHSVKSLTRA